MAAAAASSRWLVPTSGPEDAPRDERLLLVVVVVVVVLVLVLVVVLDQLQAGGVSLSSSGIAWRW